MVDVQEREGGDITYADMIASDSVEPSKIQEYFAGTNVFITGATGFLGKLIMEKILRTCKDVGKIYILIREKKGKSIEKRYEELLDNVFFDRIKYEQPKFSKKIEMLTGDLVSPYLGLNETDKQKLIDEVHCIFHCAATVRFDEKIRRATHINVRATRDLLHMAKDMKQLKSFVYVSTAFSNCVSKEIREEFYEPVVSADKLLTLVETLNEDMLDQITPTIIGKWPNTYAFTKAVAEDVVKAEGKGLPVAVVRPAIVIATVKEPLAGWIDNMYGATGVTVGAAVGLIHTLHCKKNLQADIVPADYVINCTIAAAWDVGITKGGNNNEITTDAESSQGHSGDDIPIYNYVCSTQAKITWARYMKYAEKYLTQVPSPLQVWHYFLILNSNPFMHYLCAILFHKVPAYIVDFLAFCLGRQQLLVKGYQKIDKFMNVLEYFTTQEWMFRSHNVFALWDKLNSEDKKDFEFNMRNFEWDSYFYTYARGGRVYLMKDPLETIPQGRVKYLKLQVAHYTLVALLLLGLIKLFMILWNAVF